MSLSKLFWWVYRLSPVELVWILLVCTLVFFWLLRRLRGRSFPAAMLMLWLGAALWATILNRSGETMGSFQAIPFHSYREMMDTGNREILRSSFMNVALFYPGGLLLAAILPKRWRLAVTVVAFAALSMSIEITQHALFLGRGEIDDVLHNTLGAVCGCLALSLEPKLSQSKRRRKSP